MKRKSIFKNNSQNIDAAFIEAGLPEKVLLVPLDFAKSTHYACFCDGLGRYLRQAFTVKNTKEGLDYLVERIEATRKSRAIGNKRHVIIGGEDSASYTRNFMQRLNELGYLAVRLSSCEVHRQAESVDSSTGNKMGSNVEFKYFRRPKNLSKRNVDILCLVPFRIVNLAS